MMKDPYQRLRIKRDADPEAIKLAYRKLAKKLHPDQNPGNPDAEQRFKDITQAYNLLSDPKTRRDYDSGRIDADGQRQPQSQTRPQPSKRAAGGHHHVGWWRRGIDMMIDRVAGKFGGVTRDETQAARSSQAGQSKEDANVQEPPHRIEVDFRTALLGGKHRMTRGDGKAIEIDIPPGSDDNTILRLKGQGHGNDSGKGNGDLLIALRVRDHPFFTKRGLDLYLDVPVSLKEAILGSKIRVPTIDGAVWLNIPAKANSGQTLRLKEKGGMTRTGERGDQYVRLMIMLPNEPDAVMAADLERLAAEDDRDVRSGLGWF